MKAPGSMAPCTLQDDVKISGTVTGTIVCKGKISVTETGNLKRILKQMKLKLPVLFLVIFTAVNSVKMLKPARYEGVVQTPSLSVESGVISREK